jgi:DNA-binding response OmpR family regulator
MSKCHQHRATILLVEDTPDLAQIIRRELEAAGYAVLYAADGFAALQVYAQKVPDLVVLDWMLPKLDGLEVLRRIRQSSAVPVLMLTARSEEADRVIGLELGADDYLSKPFSMRELVARVRAMLRRAERIREMVRVDRAISAPMDRTGGERGDETGTHSQALCYGPLRLDPEAHLATISGQVIDLSKTEFDLLHLLLRNPGRAFSRAYLLDTVWGTEYVGGDRSVDNVMLRLRKKLGALGDQIETVWGVGYRLRPQAPEVG